MSTERAQPAAASGVDVKDNNCISIASSLLENSVEFPIFNIPSKRRQCANTLFWIFFAISKILLDRPASLWQEVSMTKMTVAEKLTVQSVHEDRAAPRTLSELVYRRLRSDIIWGKLAPGAPLRSDELRQAYDIGISPLREALARLVSERIVTSTGQRGFRVAPIGKKDVIDVTETRVIIETAALKRSIENGDVAWESALVAAHHAFSRSRIPTSQGPDAEFWAARHRALHLALLVACGSEWQLHLAALFFDQAERFRISAIRIPESTSGRDPAKEHQEIVTAALDRDSKRAVGLLEQHYRSTMRLVLETLESRGEDDGD